MKRKLADVCGRLLTERASLNPAIWVLDGDLADSDGAEAFAKDFPERFIGAGIAEQTMVSTAAGLASLALQPWVFSFAAFVCFRAYDQIRTCISQTGLPVVLVGSHAGGCGGRNGKSHVALNDLAAMASLPRMCIWTPADEHDMKLAVHQLTTFPEPSYVRLPRDPQEPLPGEARHMRWIGTPSKVAIASCGLSTQWAVEAQRLLSKKGINVGILHFAKPWPMQKVELASYVDGVSTLIVVEDHSPYGGLGAMLQAACRQIETIEIAWPHEWSGQSGNAHELRELFSLDSKSLASKIIALVN
jgi:transketolase